VVVILIQIVPSSSNIPNYATHHMCFSLYVSHEGMILLLLLLFKTMLK
jgi:hypothetical protein